MNAHDDAYLSFLERLRRGTPITEDEWLFHFDHQNADARSGPEIGEESPDFALPDQHGELRAREELMDERGALLVFARSADW